MAGHMRDGWLAVNIARYDVHLRHVNALQKGASWSKSGVGHEDPTERQRRGQLLEIQADGFAIGVFLCDRLSRDKPVVQAARELQARSRQVVRSP